ncbi:MAG: hypothetical protein WDZ29_00620 [Balneolaceae bacterium]
MTHTLPVPILTLLLSLWVPPQLSGQFLTVEIEVPSEVNATVESNLSFGSVVAGNGISRVELGDMGMGVFGINGLTGQRLHFTLNLPERLTATDPAITATIPIRMEAALVDFGVNDYRLARPFTLPTEDVTIQPPPNAPGQNWSSVFLYLYGEVEVGNIPNATYSGEIVLDILYD